MRWVELYIQAERPSRARYGSKRDGRYSLQPWDPFQLEGRAAYSADGVPCFAGDDE